MTSQGISRIGRAPLVAALLILCGSATLGAQLAPGDIVRLLGEGREIARGAFVSVDTAGLLLRNASGDTTRYHLVAIEGMEVLRGRHRAGWSSVGKGMAIGTGVGALVAVGVMQAAGERSTSRESSGLAAMAAVLLGWTSGTLIGTAASFRTVEDWRVVTVPVDSIERAEELHGRRFRGARAIGIGGLAGTGIGAIQMNPISVAIFSAGGPIAGGFMALKQDEDWREFDPRWVTFP